MRVHGCVRLTVGHSWLAWKGAGSESSENGGDDEHEPESVLSCEKCFLVEGISGSIKAVSLATSFETNFLY